MEKQKKLDIQSCTSIRCVSVGGVHHPLPARGALSPQPRQPLKIISRSARSFNSHSRGNSNPRKHLQVVESRRRAGSPQSLKARCKMSSPSSMTCTQDMQIVCIRSYYLVVHCGYARISMRTCGEYSQTHFSFQSTARLLAQTAIPNSFAAFSCLRIRPRYTRQVVSSKCSVSTGPVRASIFSGSINERAFE